jgi:hypothetical protein
MHPALYSWRDELPRTVVRALAYLGALALLSIAAAQLFQAPDATTGAAPDTAARPDWVAIDKPFPAFALAIPEAANAPFHYAIWRHRGGNGRKDVLDLGDVDAPTPYLHVEIYRPGSETTGFADARSEIADSAAALAPRELHVDGPLESKFGPLSVVDFKTGKGTPRSCLGFVRAFDDPMLEITGWFCQGGAFVARDTLACALDRLTLLSAGSEPKVGALFAKAELARSFCGQHDPILASTPKYRTLWKALANRHDHRIGR